MDLLICRFFYRSFSISISCLANCYISISILFSSKQNDFTCRFEDSPLSTQSAKLGCSGLCTIAGYLCITILQVKNKIKFKNKKGGRGGGEGRGRKIRLTQSWSSTFLVTHPISALGVRDYPFCLAEISYICNCSSTVINIAFFPV